MDRIADNCAGYLEREGLAHGLELYNWRELFKQRKVLFDEVMLGTSYLTLVVAEKRKQCFDKFGFSPEAGPFCEWAVVNGLSPESEFLSWERNSDVGYAYGPGDFLVLIGFFRAKTFSKEIHTLFGSKERMGPKRVVDLALPIQVIPEPIVVDELQIDAGEEVAVAVESEVERTVLEDERKVPDSAYLSVFVPEVRSDVFDQLGPEPALEQVFVSEYPYVGDVELRKVNLVWRPGDVNAELAEEAVALSGFYGALCLACATDANVREVRGKVDGQHYGQFVKAVHTIPLSVVDVWKELRLHGTVADGGDVIVSKNPIPVVYPNWKKVNSRVGFSPELCDDDRVSRVVKAVIGANVSVHIDDAVDALVNRCLIPAKGDIYYISSCSLSNQPITITDSVFDGFGEYAEIMMNACAEGGRMSLGLFVAWCVWFIRRGFPCDVALSKHGSVWRADPANHASSRSMMIDMVTLLGREIFTRIDRRGYDDDLAAIQSVCGFTVGKSFKPGDGFSRLQFVDV